MTWSHPEAWFLIPGVFVFFFLGRLLILRRIHLLETFGQEIPRHQRKFPWLIGLGSLFLLVALTGLGIDMGIKNLETQGQNSLFLVDVSRSMLSQDIQPNRLERMKLSLEDLVPMLRNDRVSLYAFSGSTVLKVPYTRDLTFFQQALEDLSPQSAARGGTLLGDSLRYLLSTALNAPDLKNTVVFLLTDGGDMESFPVDAAKRLGEKGAKLVILGLGTPQGAPVPGESGELIYKGEVVRSNLNETLLKEMAEATPGGAYQNALTQGSDLRNLYQNHRAQTLDGTGKTTITDRWDLSWFFLWPGLICFLWTPMRALFDKNSRRKE